MQPIPSEMCQSDSQRKVSKMTVIAGMTNIVRVGLMQEWAHQDLNLEPADYESDALTN